MNQNPSFKRNVVVFLGEPDLRLVLERFQKSDNPSARVPGTDDLLDHPETGGEVKDC